MTSESSSRLPLVKRMVGEVVVITIDGAADLTSSHSAELIVDVQRVIGAAQQAVFDLSPVEFIDSSGLGALVSLNRALSRQGGELKLAGPTRDVHAVFEMVRLHRLFEIHPSVEAAVGSFSDDS